MDLNPWGCRESDTTEHTHREIALLFFLTEVNVSQQNTFQLKKVS